MVPLFVIANPDSIYNGNCPLCESMGAELFYQDNNKRSKRPYYQCQQCQLVFVPSDYFLSRVLEKAEYDLHENQLHDEGYQRFLSRLWLPLKDRLEPTATVLEFGCGPGPALATMMLADGFEVELYDSIYRPNTEVLIEGRFQAITATEVIEHLHFPKKEIEAWLSYLETGGTLGLMTKLVKNQQAFTKWHYKNDLTHVCFYSKATFEWLAARYHLHLELLGDDVIFLGKQTPS